MQDTLLNTFYACSPAVQARREQESVCAGETRELEEGDGICLLSTDLQQAIIFSKDDVSPATGICSPTLTASSMEPPVKRWARSSPYV